MKEKVTRREFIKRSFKGSIFMGLGGGSLLIKGCSTGKEYDLLISGGMVFDGTQASGRKVDLGIKQDKIVAIEKNIKTEKARKVIDARNYAVSPGFIDAHSHTDVGLLVNPKAESKIRQGVTTEINGNCGYSPFPIASSIWDETRDRMKDEYDLELDWNDIQGFFQRLEKRKMALNYATLLGQGSLRGAVVGFDDKLPTKEELQHMKSLVAANMRAGAVGLSTGLEYAPGSYADTGEITELCRQVAKLGGVYATHIRDEGDDLLLALDEAVVIAQDSGVSLQVSHLKVAYPRNWSKITAALQKIEKAQEQGVSILADRYPYIAGSTGLSFYFPLWAKQGTTSEFISRLQNPDYDDRLRGHIRKQEKKLGSWDKVLICSVFTPKNKFLEGKTVLQGAGELQEEPYEFMRDLLIEEQNRVSMIIFMMKEENLKQILAHPLVVIGSDGTAVAPYGVLHKGKPHPRFYGTFPRVLGKYVREDKLFSLEKAIQKMTSLTARKFGLSAREQIKSGYYADLVIFDPDQVADKATWAQPHIYPSGIKTVIVNGQIVVEEGNHTGRLPGKILKRNGA